MQMGDPGLRSRAERVFSRIAPHYDAGNQLLSGGRHQAHRRRLVRWAAPARDARVLDLACGTGDLTWLLAEAAPEGEVIGVDVTREMLDLARDKGQGGRVRFVEGDAAELPFQDGSFDLVTCGFAGRWFGDWEGVLDEVWRVLRPGGAFWNVDFGRPASALVDRGYLAALVGAGAVVGTVLGGEREPYGAIASTVRAYPGQRWLEQRLRTRGFVACTYERQLGTLAYNLGRKPRRDATPAPPR